MSADGTEWFLVNASPDLRAQIEAFCELQPKAGQQRNSPIRGVLLTNADLDHVLGLTLLREGAKLNVYATPAVRETLQNSLGLDRLLGAFSGIQWIEPVTEFIPLERYAIDCSGCGHTSLRCFDGESQEGRPFFRDGQTPRRGVPTTGHSPFENVLTHTSLVQREGDDAGLLVRMIPLPSGPPRFARGESSHTEGHSIAYQFQDGRTGAKLLVAPDVAEVTPALAGALGDSDAVLFDGTFWSDDELQRISPGARTSREMGHLPVHGGSLDVLQSLRARHRIYLHINNTNPILAARSPQRAAVEAAGVRVGEDGWEFEL